MVTSVHREGPSPTYPLPCPSAGQTLAQPSQSLPCQGALLPTDLSPAAAGVSENQALVFHLQHTFSLSSDDRERTGRVSSAHLLGLPLWPKGLVSHLSQHGPHTPMAFSGQSVLH